MKTVIKLKNPSSESLLSILEHLLKNGQSDFFVFSTFFYGVQDEISNKVLSSGGKIVFLKSYQESTRSSLMNIRGSLTERFLIVYSEEICKFDIKNAEKQHKSSTLLSTLLSNEIKTVGAIFETEIFDYMAEEKHFEREIIPRVFEDGEVHTLILKNFQKITWKIVFHML